MAPPAGKTTSRSLTLILCFGLIVTYMSQGLMITASKNESGGYDYDKNMSVLMSEVCKFAISAALLGYKSYTASPGSAPLTSKLGMSTFKFAVPAVLYAIHNNIIFIALGMISPVTYQLFNNIKIVATGLVFRIFLNRALALKQWMAIILLPLSMCVTQFVYPTKEGDGSLVSESQEPEQQIFTGFLWMVVLSLCSAFAGVYNEYLLKTGDTSSLMWKNMQLYFFSIISLFIPYLFQAKEPGTGWFDGFNAMAWGVVVMNGMLGQIISAIFYYADNIVKVYAASGAVLLTPFVSKLFFGTQLDTPLFVGIGIALISLFLYFLPMEQLAANDVEIVSAIFGRSNKPKTELTIPLTMQSYKK